MNRTSRKNARALTPARAVVLLSILIALAASACPAGQKALPPAPVHLGAPPPDWKELVYEEMNKHVNEKNRQQNVRYLFLDPPIPCTARLRKKGFIIAFGKDIKQGHGGVVLKKMISGSFLGKRSGVDKDATVFFYLIEADSGKVSFYSGEQLESAEVTPPIITVETIPLSNGYKVELRAAILDPLLRVESAAFRAIPDVKTFDQWPPYK